MPSKPLLKALWGAKVWVDIHNEGVTDALVLTYLNLASSIVCQKQSNGDASQGVLYTALIGFECFCIRWYGGEFIYTFTWGFQHCSFRQLGQCEGLNTWNEQQTGSTFPFFVYLRNIILTANQGVVGLLDNKDNESSWYFVRPIFDVVCFTFICSNLKGAS